MLMKLADLLTLPQMKVYEKAQGFWVSRAIAVACELNLADNLPEFVGNIQKIEQI